MPIISNFPSGSSLYSKVKAAGYTGTEADFYQDLAKNYLPLTGGRVTGVTEFGQTQFGTSRVTLHNGLFFYDSLDDDSFIAMISPESGDAGTKNTLRLCGDSHVNDGDDEIGDAPVLLQNLADPIEDKDATHVAFVNKQVESLQDKTTEALGKKLDLTGGEMAGAITLGDNTVLAKRTDDSSVTEDIRIAKGQIRISNNYKSGSTFANAVMSVINTVTNGRDPLDGYNSLGMRLSVSEKGFSDDTLIENMTFDLNGLSVNVVDPTSDRMPTPKSYVDAVIANNKSGFYEEVVSYIGTGTEGASNPVTVQFSFKPDIITLVGKTYSSSSNAADKSLLTDQNYKPGGAGLFPLIFDELPTDSWATFTQVYGSRTCMFYYKRLETGYGIQYYCSATGSSGDYQANKSGYTYYWKAFRNKEEA